jgi:murein DD-endopeptidase MepM/ murein hydrolase activator NlpD
MTEQQLPSQIRKSRLSFMLSVILILGLAAWLFREFVEPEPNSTRISARPVPAAPFIAPEWLNKDPMIRVNQTVTLEKGGTLIEMLEDHGVDPVTADRAMDALVTGFDPRRLRDGQSVRLFFEWYPGETEADRRFAGLDLIPAPTERVIVRRLQDDSFRSVAANRPLTERPFLTDTKITSSLYQAARLTGMAPSMVLELIRLFSFTVDFQREIREGDRLEVLYTSFYDPDGKLADTGKILFAALTIKGERRAYWRYKAENDEEALYYDEAGDSMTRLLMKTPLDGARLSSRYGLRKHPILGYTKLHRGVDFAARRGTPVYAAGDGEITALGREGDHGKRIRIRHNDGFKTLYAHLNRYARNMSPGVQVQQGQVIGYVGMSGLATGPHLHYEVTRNGKTANPLRLELPVRRKLDTVDKIDFDRTRQNLNSLVENLAAGLESGQGG